jgi:tellurite resistance protein TerC
MIVWISFFVIVFIILDLGVFNKTPHIISTKEATKWTVIWVTIFFSFWCYLLIYANNYISNPDDLKPIGAAIKFITGYLIELSLSVDNIFVIAIIFSAFKIPQKYQAQSIILVY